MNKRAIFLTILLLVFLFVLTAFTLRVAPVDPPPMWVAPNTTQIMYCKGDTFIVQPYSKTEIAVTCRVWVTTR